MNVSLCFVNVNVKGMRVLRDWLCFFFVSRKPNSGRGRELEVEGQFEWVFLEIVECEGVVGVSTCERWPNLGLHASEK